jgi:hypothetical protein
MSIRRTRSVTLVRGRASARGVVLLATAFMVEASSGCLSNEYRIQKDELGRLAALPPEARGQSVRVSQTLGERRGDAVEPPSAVPREALADDDGAGHGSANANVNIDLGGDGHGGGPSCPSRDFHGAPPSGGGHMASAPGAFHGAPTGGGHVASAPGAFHGAPTGGGHGGGFNLGGLGGGGGNGGDVLVVLAVVAIVGATLATVALAASEGVRYEGHAQLTPRQLVYLKEGGRTEAVPLLELSRAQVATADSALVMDDEGDGLRRLDHAPLDRRGGMFRFDLGSGLYTFGDARASGVSAHIQGGLYLTRTFGLVLDLGLGVATPDACCAGATTGAISRHSLGLEAQALPLALGPVHLGGFAGGGVALTSASGPIETGPMASAGALFELDLTSHMALAVRGGANAAWFPSGLSTAGTVSGGLAIY